MENPKFTLFQGKDGQFYFKLIARNGEPIFASEGYASKSGCMDGINSVKNNAVKDEHFKRLIAANGEFFFTLMAENGEVIGKSETYKTQQGGNNGIEAVKTTAPNAPVEDKAIAPEIKIFEGVNNNSTSSPVEEKAVIMEPKINEPIKKVTPAPVEKATTTAPQPQAIVHPTSDGSTRLLLWVIIFILMLILSLNILQIIMYLFA
jgi:uncharacterized protein